MIPVLSVLQQMAPEPQNGCVLALLSRTPPTSTGADGLKLVQSAMKHWSNHTCIKFVERTTERDYILFVESLG